MDPAIQENVALPQAQPTSIEQPKQNNFLVILLSVLLLLSVSIAGFFAYQTQTLVKELTLLRSSPTPVSLNDLTIDTTSDWKTYTNEKIGFSLKYPDTWTELNDSLITKNKCNSIVIISQSYNLSLSEFLVKEYNDPEYKINMSPKITTIDGNEAQIFGSLGIGEVQNIYIKNGSKMIIIRESASVPEGGDPENYWGTNCKNFDAQTDQILSTFKFIDSNSNVPKSISTLFDSINTKFNLNLVPTEESQFYSPSGPITKKSWKIDLMDANLGKQLPNFLNSQLILNSTESAGIGGGGVDAYENSDIKCFHSFMSQGPDIHNYLTCAEK